MKPTRYGWICSIAVVAALSPCAARGEASRYGAPPLRFEENVGQVDSEVAYLTRGAGHRVFLTRAGATIDLDGTDAAGRPARAAVRMRVAGARPDCSPQGEGRLGSTTRYYLADRAELRAPHFESVRYENVLAGVDLVYYGDPRRLEYDFVVRPGAEPDAIALQYEGADAVRLTPSGDIELATAAGTVRLRAPLAYQLVDGERRKVESRYELLAEGSVGFRVGVYDADRPLVIDPVLVYAAYLGGAGADVHAAIRVNESGEAYVVGSTRSLDFPATPGAVQTAPAGGRCGGALIAQPCFDVFAAKLSADGSRLLWATYLGGGADDRAADAALAPDGSLFITGTTVSGDMPTSPGAAQRNTTDAPRPLGDAFVVRLGPGGDRVFATRVGGSRADNGVAIDVDADGAAHLVGHTFSDDLPFPSGIVAGDGKAGTPDSSDVFVATIAPDGGRIGFGAYLGGSRDERAGGIAALADGGFAVTGSTGSADFPVSDDAFQPRIASDRADAFLTIYRRGRRAFSSYFGGSGSDAGKGLEQDRAGALVMIGDTESRDFPTAVGPQIRWKRSLGFVARFPRLGAPPEIASYLVGTADELALGADSSIYVGGVVASSSPLFGGAAVPDCEGSLLRKILPTGRLAFSGLVPGLGAIDVDRAGAVYSAGTDVSGALRTSPGVFNAVHAGQSDVYVSKLELETDRTISLTCVEHGASLAPAEIAPGEIVSLFGTGLGPQAPAGVVLENGRVQSNVAGVRALFNGMPGPLLFVWSNQINAVVPYAIDGAEKVRIEVEYDGRVSNSLELPVADAHPGLFSFDATGNGLGALFNEDGTKNTVDNPAKPGSVVQLFGTGEGQTAPAGVDGLVASENLASLARPRQPVSVKIGGVDAELLYAGAAPGLVSGVLQLNVRIPPATPAGEAAVQVAIGGKLNRQVLTVAVE